MTRWFAGYRAGALLAVFEIDSGFAREIFATSQVTWSIAESAKSFSIECDGCEGLKKRWNDFVAQEKKGTADHSIDRLVERALPPGAVFCRMARTNTAYPSDMPSVYPARPREIAELHQSLVELSSLLNRLAGICRVIDPTCGNFSATGTEISEALVLSCIAIENHLRLILERNGYSRKRFTTTDYVKALAPMKLGDYQVGFCSFPWLPESAPFLAWDKSAPTDSLQWFRRYNNEKHNRYSIKDKPTLQDVFDGLVAFAVILIAQFGGPAVLRANATIRDALRLASYPRWDLGDCYISPSGNAQWQYLHYEFG